MAQNKNNNMGNQDKEQTDGLREKMINVKRLHVVHIVKPHMLRSRGQPMEKPNLIAESNLQRAGA